MASLPSEPARQARCNQGAWPSEHATTGSRGRHDACMHACMRACVRATEASDAGERVPCAARGHLAAC
eukprot:365130-Chlamydomonas_euryale.AAC.24